MIQRCASSLPTFLVALVLVLAGSAAAAREAVRVQIDSPAPGVDLQDHVHQVRVEGKAFANADRPLEFEVMLAIDVSASTNTASGVDVDGDGTVGFNPQNELLPPGAYPTDVKSTDPQDTILHAQILAAHRLLDGLDATRVRVGVITFSGDVDPTTLQRKRMDQEDARLDSPLTDDFDRVRRVLNMVLARGAGGATNFAAGVRLGIRELSALSGAKSRPREHARKVILFLTDGSPTLPIGRGNVVDAGDNEAAVRAAQLAHKAGIVVNTYALGPQALRYPKAATEMARVTLGTYTPVQKPGDIIALIQGVSFADVEDVVFTNLSTGELSTDVRLNPDGTFSGFVPVREGENRVRVNALSSDGGTGAIEFDLTFHRADLPGREPMDAIDRIREQNKELEIHRLNVEIEAFRDRLRKEVEIEAEENPRVEEPAPGADAP